MVTSLFIFRMEQVSTAARHCSCTCTAHHHRGCAQLCRCGCIVCWASDTARRSQALDRKISYWDAYNGTAIRILEPATSDSLGWVAVSSSGSTLVTGAPCCMLQHASLILSNRGRQVQLPCQQHAGHRCSLLQVSRCASSRKQRSLAQLPYQPHGPPVLGQRSPNIEEEILYRR